MSGQQEWAIQELLFLPHVPTCNHNDCISSSHACHGGSMEAGTPLHQFQHAITANSTRHHGEMPTSGPLGHSPQDHRSNATSLKSYIKAVTHAARHTHLKLTSVSAGRVASRCCWDRCWDRGLPLSAAGSPPPSAQGGIPLRIPLRSDADCSLIARTPAARRRCSTGRVFRHCLLAMSYIWRVECGPG